MARFRAVLAAVLLSLTFAVGACSADADVDTGGDGVKLEGDVDAEKKD